MRAVSGGSKRTKYREPGRVDMKLHGLRPPVGVLFPVADGPPPNHGFAYRDIVARGRRSGEIVMTGVMKIGGGTSGGDYNSVNKQSVSACRPRSGSATLVTVNTISAILLMAAAT